VEYNWHADSGRVGEAAAALDWWLEQSVPRPMQAIWSYEAVWFEVFSRNDLAAARERLRTAARFRDETGAAVAIWKAEAAIAAAEGRPADAAAAAHETEQALRRAPIDSGLARAIREDLAVLLARYSAAAG
jgi:hypothetical protein